MTAVLALADAAFRHPGGAGISGVRLEVAPGEAVALIGPNGAGKSTLLRGILGLVPLVDGEMRIGGDTDAADGMIGFLPQTAEIDPDFPISLEQVVMQGRYRRLGLLRWPGRHDRQVVRGALGTVGLADRARTPFGDLSGGQRQRGLLARALASEPAFLLLDEPFNGLDQTNRDALLETVRQLKARGVAIIVSTHDLELAREVCDTVLLLNGRQVGCGPVEEMLTLEHVQECFEGVGVEIDEHTLVVPDHEGH
ncbi:metal ABC transporter ATP-binding protein [Agromyces marinus]|uniref:ABC transporter ATP-binding protein n=1 Tax=Agromyces marinus TaxID=1389020 RepID=A0ABM8H269_9MICO|nr:metal ABC transporter ATP-binding protein [Agromyces marinus]UIP60065.1 Manganese transport system ATP-binding protein MntB [Agromyces marinus]BDZ54822.1 ABC transporter ATP-binding protein [Agromyces marinus]